MPAASPLTQYSDLVNVSISVNGTTIDASYSVLSVTVVKEVNKIPYARVQILDGDPSSENFTISATDTFIPGNTLVINAGYHGQTDIIFSGIIIKHSIKTLNSRTPILVVEARDAAVRMTIGRKNAYFTMAKDSDLITQLISSYPDITGDVDATTTVQEMVVQYYATDWDMLLCRADVNGMVVLTDQNKVSVKKIDTSLSPALLLTYGDSIVKFDLEMDARSQLSSAQAISWDQSTQAIIQANSVDPGLKLPGDVTLAKLASVTSPSNYQLQSSAPIAQNDLQVWANAQIIKSAMSKIRGTVSFQGSSLVNPGTLVTLDGLGTRFDGNAYVSAVRHTIEEGDWMTEVAIGGSPEWITESREHIMAPAASGLVPAIPGLQIGVVSKIDKDPDNEFRVQVKIPIVDAATATVWARLSTFYTTTSKQGSYFYPEVSDEVILGFLNDDPRFPVILGSVYSSSNNPPYTPDDKNTYKAIVTNSGIKIEVNDDKKIVTIETPAKNSIVLSDDAQSITLTDQNSNSIKMSSDGIAISSASNITIKATGNITSTSDGNTTIKATGDAQISGANFSAQGQAQATVQGNASAQLTASGKVAIKGAMVMIN